MTKKKKKPKFNKDSAIRSSIRRVYSRSPDVIAAKNAVRRESVWYKKDGTPAKKPRVEYQCAICTDWHMGKDIQVDHRVPVIDPELGFQTWDIFVERVFCPVENLDVLCKTCHKAKTDEEKRIRAINRKLAKQNQGVKHGSRSR